MEDDWDAEPSATPAAISDANNNETKISGFGNGGGFGAENETSTIFASGSRGGFGGGLRGRGGGFGVGRSNDGEKKSVFGGGDFGSKNDDGETKSSGFGSSGFGCSGFGQKRDGFGGGGEKTCFKCKETGHMSRECPNAGSGLGEKTCFKCKEIGHMSRECPNAGSGVGDNKCFKCGESGHMSRECTKEGRLGGRSGGFVEHKESGSGFSSGFSSGFAKTDDTDGESKSGFGGRGGRFGGFGSRSGGGESGGGGDKTCFKCKETGHMSRECPNAGSGGDNKCFKCGESGHMSRECTKEAKEGEVKRERYIPEVEDDSEASLFHNITVGVNFEKQSEIAVTLTGDGSEEITPLRTFSDAKLSELLITNVTKSNYKIPTPVQKYAIPTILKKRDLMACAQTGSGKTAAYVLPIMTNILHDGIESSAFSQVQEPQALILSPTRELASQIYNECRKFSLGSIIKSGILYGGVDMGFQVSNLSKGCNILVATPGRLLGVLERGKISLAKVKYFVLDEADRMLDMGFEKDVRDILSKGSIQGKGERVTLMFSATFPKEIQQLAQDFLSNYLFLAVGIVGGANSDVEQTLYKVTRFDKREKVVELLNDIGQDKVMLFTEHKKQADVLAFYLIQKGYPTTSLHGDRLQSQRELALKDFKSGKSNIIVCTSVAARGLDIEKVNHVINVDLPQTIDEYVHRIGRTGRCGNIGKAISFFDPSSENDVKLARPLARILLESGQTVPDWLSSSAEDAVGTTYSKKECTDDLRVNKATHLQEEEDEEW